jgi:hypothetical protein
MEEKKNYSRAMPITTTTAVAATKEIENLISILDLEIFSLSLSLLKF